MMVLLSGWWKMICGFHFSWREILYVPKALSNWFRMIQLLSRILHSRLSGSFDFHSLCWTSGLVGTESMMDCLQFLLQPDVMLIAPLHLHERSCGWEPHFWRWMVFGEWLSMQQMLDSWKILSVASFLMVSVKFWLWHMMKWIPMKLLVSEKLMIVHLQLVVLLPRPHPWGSQESQRNLLSHQMQLWLIQRPMLHPNLVMVLQMLPLLLQARQKLCWMIDRSWMSHSQFWLMVLHWIHHFLLWQSEMLALFWD